MAIITPVTQTVKLDPYNGRLFEFNNVDSRIYLTRTINTMLDIYGMDIVVEGLILNPLSLVYNNISNTLAFTITAGSAVADQTLVSLTADEAVSLNTAGLNLHSGSFAIFINFEYLNQFGGNKLRLKTVWFDSTTNTTANPTDIDILDRVLIGIIDFDAAGTTPSIRTTNAYDVTTLRSSGTTATINTVVHPLYPRSAISDNLARIILDSFY